MTNSVQWCDLPSELLKMIIDRLPSRLDVLRFHCVCKSWNFTTPYPNKTVSFLSDSIFYCIEPPPPPMVDENSPYFSSSPSFQGWMVKVNEVGANRLRLICPFSNRRIDYPSFSRGLNLLDFRVSELCKGYALRSGLDCGIFVKKVVPSPYARDLVIAIWWDGKLRYSYSQDYEWDLIGDGNIDYEDIAIINEQVYVVDTEGTVSWVKSSFNLVPYSPSVHSSGLGNGIFGKQKNLVESDGGIYVVDRYETVRSRRINWQRGVKVFLENCRAKDSNKVSREILKMRIKQAINWLDDESAFKYTEAVDLKVYKLDEEWGRWVEVKSLGDRLFVLANDCCFSVSARNFAGCAGNCIYFTNRKDERSSCSGFHDDNVFKLDDGGQIGRLDVFPAGYTQLFWPPPNWLRPRRFLPWC